MVVVVGAMRSSMIFSWVSLACVAMLASQNAMLTSRLTAAEERLDAFASAHGSFPTPEKGTARSTAIAGSHAASSTAGLSAKPLSWSVP